MACRSRSLFSVSIAATRILAFAVYWDIVLACCGPNAMYCPSSGACISTRSMCNGRNDCPSGEDESSKYCSSSCSGQFSCSDVRCIGFHQVCEVPPALNDCADGKDEDPELCGCVIPLTTMPALQTTRNITTTQLPTTGSPTTTELPVDSCEPMLINITKSQREVQLPRTLSGERAILLCIDTGAPLLVALCIVTLPSNVPSFAIETEDSDCADSLSSSTERLGDLTMEEVTDSNVLNIAAEVLILTNISTSLGKADIAYTSYILENLSRYSVNTSELTILIELSSLVGGTVSNVMDADETILLSSDEDTTSSSRIVKSLDAILLAATEVLASTGGSITLHVESQPNLSYQIGANSSIVGLELCTTNGTAFGQAVPAVSRQNAMQADKCFNSLAQITLSQDVSGLPRTFTIYYNNKLFRSLLNNELVTSRVLSAQLSKTEQATELGPNSTLVLIKQSITSYGSIDLYNVGCGYWNFTVNDWQTDGCTVIELTAEEITCACNHLTNFAVLLVPKGTKINPIHDIVLTYISIVFLSISSVALAFVVISTAIYRKLRKSDSQKLIFCLSLALLCMNMLFIFGIDAIADDSICEGIAVSLHYFLLSSFALMMAEAVLQYLRLVKVLGAHVSYFIWKATVPSFGIPAVAVIAIWAIDPSLYHEKDQYCWVQPSLQVYGVMIPIGAVLVVNGVIFALIVRALRCGGNKHLGSTMSERKLAVLHAKATISISVLLGLTWIFGFLAIGGASIVFQYLFCIFNSLQGLLIFIFHNLRAPFVMHNLGRFLSRSSRATSTSKSIDAVGHRDSHSTQI